MTIQQANNTLKISISGLYDSREASNIANLVMEKLTGKTRTARLVDRETNLPEEKEILLNKYISELITSKPVQYVLEEAHFYGMNLEVNEAVLIPRPETEELVDWISMVINSSSNPNEIELLDIGTGSGCIALALKKNYPAARIIGLDKSSAALKIAQNNARKLELSVHFLEADILQTEYWNSFGLFDVIVSNPPYITISEKVDMHQNVLAFEPHSALFVPDKEPLLFYNSIALFAKSHLKKGGLLFFEINENFAREIKTLLIDFGFDNVVLKKDLQNKMRMVSCVFI